MTIKEFMGNLDSDLEVIIVDGDGEEYWYTSHPSAKVTGVKISDGVVTIYTEFLRLYTYEHGRSQTFGVVMATSEMEARIKIREKSDIADCYNNLRKAKDYEDLYEDSF